MPNRDRGFSPLGPMGLLGSLARWLGVAAVTCGGILVGRAEISARLELQTIGLPILFGGILALAMSVILQGERGRSETILPAPAGKRRVDPKSTGPRRGPHARHPSGKAA